jgi:hypothetical protein
LGGAHARRGGANGQAPVRSGVDFAMGGMGHWTADEGPMARTFKVGDQVTWNSEAGHVTGRIVRVHTKDVNHRGYVHHASKDNPQYEIESDKTDHIALHKARALRRLG